MLRALPVHSQGDVLQANSEAQQSLLSTYPACKSCGASVCGIKVAVCACPDRDPQQAEFQRELNLLRKELNLAERSRKKTEDTPFRQLRNAYGFGTSVIGGVNILLTHLVALTVAVAVPVLVAPALVLGTYVYFRGRREEREINADAKAELTSKKLKLLALHRESVIQRYEHPERIQGASLQSKPQTPLQKSKEKRSLFGNPFSHLVVSSLATFSVLNTIIKLALVGALLGAGGPFIWAGAAVLALATGAYFAHARYKYLVSKKNFDHKMALLTARTSDVEKIIKKTTKLSTRHVHQRLNTLQSENHELKTKLAELEKQISPPRSPASAPAVAPAPSPKAAANNKQPWSAEAEWSPRLHKQVTHTQSAEELLLPKRRASVR